jgi:4-amino-4-deoxy-L-arabinose transferase-like glycosyltransferase
MLATITAAPTLTGRGARGGPGVAPALVVLLAAALRVAWVLLVPTKPVGDFAMYLESAVHLLEHGRLDPEFVYMPGYVMLAAAVMGLGGGLLAVKLVLGALLAALGAGAVYGITASFWGRREALAASVVYALWPAGIAVSSVTGTDMPAAVLVLLSAWALVSWGGSRPWLATVAFGAAMGLAAYVRAVAVPLAAFSLFHFRATGASWRQSAGRAAAGALIALLVLSPWVLRNHARYGEWIFTDSHGGLTALVGANPNSDGRYSRSLNRIFKEVTGYTLLAEPHRQADRAAYALARDLSAFSPAYAAGLVALKAERLLDRERPLLYWPVYRAGVLPDGPAQRWFDRHRPAVEAWTDTFWILLAVAFFAGAGLALARRRWQVLSLLPIQLALAGVYALYFAEVRYSLAIVALMFPVAAGVMQIGAGVKPALSQTPSGQSRGPWRREAIAIGAAVTVLLAGWPAVKAAGRVLRERNRFAAHLCRIEGRPQLCKWAPASGGESPVRGVYDGFGLILGRRDSAGRAAARMELTLPSGSYLARARLDLTPATASESELRDCHFSLESAGTTLPIAAADILNATRRSDTHAIELPIETRGSTVEIELGVTCPVERSTGAALWLSGFELSRR